MEGDVISNGECYTETGSLLDSKTIALKSRESELQKLVVLHLNLIHQQSEAINAKEKIILQIQRENELIRQRALRLERKLASVLEKNKKLTENSGSDFYGFSQSSGDAESEVQSPFWSAGANQAEVHNIGHAASSSDVFHDFASSHVISDIEVESHIIETLGHQEVDFVAEEPSRIEQIHAATDTSDLDSEKSTSCQTCLKLRQALQIKNECCFLASGRLCSHSNPTKREKENEPGAAPSQKHLNKIEKKIRFKKEALSDDDAVLTPSLETKSRKRISSVTKVERIVKQEKKRTSSENGELAGTKSEVKDDLLLSTPNRTVRWKRTATTKVTWDADSVTKCLFNDEVKAVDGSPDTPPTSRTKIDAELVPETSGLLLVEEPYHIACTTRFLNSLEAESSSSGVEIPSFCVRSYPPVYTMEGTEPLGDDVYDKRHMKFEADEKKRKRWDHQRIREHRKYIQLRARYEGDEDVCAGKQPILKSFAPDPFEFEDIGVYPVLPVSVFGMPLPRFEKRQFSIPWRSQSEEDVELRPKRTKLN